MSAHESGQPPTTTRIELSTEPLTPAAFAAFGDVIEAGAHTPRVLINQGFAERFDDLAYIDTDAAGGRPTLGIYRARARSLPFRVSQLECHDLGSQTFMPLGPHSFLVVVAPAGGPPTPARVRCFRTAPGQGVNLARGVWHHSLLALGTPCDFLVIERRAPEAAVDCREQMLTSPELWLTG